MVIGNTFSQDILTIVKPFIENYNLDVEIKHELKKDFNDSLNPEEISFEINHTSDIYQILDYINFVLLTGLDEALKNIES